MTAAAPTFVSYLRVSTKGQGRSGLGLDAQREAVASYLSGQNARLAFEFIEVESGKRSDRPKLAEALTMCRALGARLVVAKIDRLARNVHFVSGLMESGVDFVAADMPSVNRLTIHVLAAVAEEEARAISRRTKAALAEARKRGTKLGGTRWRKDTGEEVRTLTDETRRRSAAARAEKAAKRASDIMPTVASIRAKIGPNASLGAIARELTAEKVLTPSGRSGTWTAVQVSRLLERAGAS
jgi:DNA invertase Pin-like site-specific DNA recombinase